MDHETAEQLAKQAVESILRREHQVLASQHRRLSLNAVEEDGSWLFTFGILTAKSMEVVTLDDLDPRITAQPWLTVYIGVDGTAVVQEQAGLPDLLRQ